MGSVVSLDLCAPDAHQKNHSETQIYLINVRFSLNDDFLSNWLKSVFPQRFLRKVRGSCSLTISTADKLKIVREEVTGSAREGSQL